MNMIVSKGFLCSSAVALLCKKAVQALGTPVCLGFARHSALRRLQYVRVELNLPLRQEAAISENFEVSQVKCNQA